MAAHCQGHPAVGQSDPERDFIEQPSQDFFCPVTLELLTEPLQTQCCGNHFSQEAVKRLQRDGRPCPICNQPLVTVPDKYMERKVKDLRVRCPYKKGKCEWVGEVRNLGSHTDSCRKRPWHCKYCDYCSTYDAGPSKHVPICPNYPVVCPNLCEIFSVPRCELEAHLMVCPLQPVACEFAEVGCDVMVPRRDLTHHMDTSQQQHLLSATLLNLRLTRVNLAEKERIITEKEKMIVEKDKELAEKNHRISELQQRLQTQQGGLTSALHLFHGFTCHKFTVHEIGFRQKTDKGNWHSKPFYSHQEGYNLVLLLKTNGDGPVSGTHMSLKFALKSGIYDEMLAWPVEFTIQVQVINQLGDHDHHMARGGMELSRSSMYPIFKTAILKLIPLDSLGCDAERNTQYLKDDLILLQVFIKTLQV